MNISLGLRLVVAIALLTAAASASPLGDLIDCADANHPNLALARAKTEAARADVTKEWSAYFPTVSLASKASVSDARLNASRTITKDVTSHSLALEQLVWDWGRTWSAERGALERVALAEKNEATDRARIHLAVTEKYIGSQLANGLYSLRARTVEDRLALRDRVSRMVDSGVRPRSDVMRAEIDLANARTQLDAAHAKVLVAEAELRDAVGVDTLPMLPAEDRLAQIPLLPIRGGAMEGGADKRPEVEAAAFTLAAEKAEHAAARRALWPTVSVTGSYGKGDREISSTTGGVNVSRTPSQPFTEWGAAAAIGWSGFNFAAKRAAIRKEAAEVAQAEASLREIRRSSGVEIQVAAANLEEALNRIHTSEAVLAAATENFSLISRRYEAGVATILDITDGQVQSTDAEAAVLQARADAWTMNARLRRALAAPELR